MSNKPGPVWKFAKRRRRLVGAALLTAVVTGTDWPTDLLTPFWGSHPIASAIGSGIVLLVFAAFVVEAVLEERELRNWDYVAKLAYYSLGHMASEVLVGMDFLVTSATQPNHIPPLGPSEARALHGVLARNKRRRAAKHQKSVDQQLHPLVQNIKWLRLAREGLSALKFRHRDHVARWIPAMAVTETRARLLNAVALVDDKRDAVEGSVIALIKRRDPAYPDAAPPAADEQAEISKLIENWVGVYQEVIALQELLMQLGRADDWRSVPGRARLSGHDEDKVNDLLSDLRKRLA